MAPPRAGPGQAFARAVIEVTERLGAEGSEVAGGFAKGVAESTLDAVDRPRLRGPASHTWQERRPRRGPRARGAGPRATSRAAGATGRRREATSALACKMRKSSLRADVISSFQASRRSKPIWPGGFAAFRRVSACGVAAAIGSYVTFPSDAGPGLCGEKLRERTLGRWEGMGVETSTGPFCQTALPGRESNPRASDLLVGDQGREDGYFSAPGGGGRGEGRRHGDRASSPRGGGGEGTEKEEGGPGPP